MYSASDQNSKPNKYIDMMRTKSESDVTSSAPSSPSRPVYYVQSPSRDSHDGDKSSTMQATPVFNSPIESPSHPSLGGRHSRNSSASRFSGIFRSSSGRKAGRKRNEKGWPECEAILEEGSYADKGFTNTRRFQALVAVLIFVVLFTVFCLILWGASRPYKAEVSMKSLILHNFYVGEGSDFSGVPTKMLTLNGSLAMIVYNPATFFGIHISPTPVTLMYSQIRVASGQMKKYYQPRKSRRVVLVHVEGNKVPLYGAGSSLLVSKGRDEVPVRLEFELRSRGDVVGRLVRTEHRKWVDCSLVVDVKAVKPIKFGHGSCTYTS